MMILQYLKNLKKMKKKIAKDKIKQKKKKGPIIDFFEQLKLWDVMQEAKERSCPTEILKIEP